MSDVTTTIDLDAVGHQRGHIILPTSTNISAWRNELIPIVAIGDPAAGPRVVIFGGTHGDEYEGQIAVNELVQTVTPDEVIGQIIAVPCLSGPAAAAGTRLWPDGVNMNRAFPGDPEGSPAHRLAHFVTTELFTRSTHVYDLHSGGHTSYMYPMSHMRRVEDPVQGREMLAGMLAWNSDIHMLYTNVAGTGLLPDTAASMDNIVVTTELGGSGLILPSTNRLGIDGLRNSLRRMGALTGEVVTREDLGLPPARIASALDERNYVFSPVRGVFESLVAPGEDVIAGQPIARIHSLEEPWRTPEVLEARAAGIVCMIRAIPLTEKGDCVVVFGQEVRAEDIW
jgi:predicted deacylase